MLHGRLHISDVNINVLMVELHWQHLESLFTLEHNPNRVIQCRAAIPAIERLDVKCSGMSQQLPYETGEPGHDLEHLKSFYIK